MEQDETTLDVDHNYVNLFKDHIAHFSSHLNGSDQTGGHLRPSYFPPCSYWSREDKEHFFHALSVHSRLRPDLIAAEIPGKTVADVCVYLDMLAEASANEPKKWRRSAFPPALDVSDEWIEFEENQARATSAMESVWDAEHREAGRVAVLRSERRALHKQKRERAEEGEDKGVEEQREAGYREFRTAQKALWEKEDFMGELDVVHLRVIDGILRESEESPGDMTSDKNLGTGSQESLDNPAENKTATVGSADENLIQPTSSVRLPHSVHDQALGQSNVSQAIVTGRDEPQQSSMLVTDLGSINNAEADLCNSETSLDNPAEPVVDLENLSPKSRRRYQKRLYMRRKRATQFGREMSTTAMRLKPGRKTNKKLLLELKRQEAKVNDVDEDMEKREEVDLKDATFTISTREEDQKETYINIHEGKEETEVLLGSDREDESRTRSPTVDEQKDKFSAFHPHIGGLTLPYKIKEELLGFGYNAETLQSEGLGLFHLLRLAEVMSLHASLQETVPDIVSRISAPLLKLLHAEVVFFVTDLMHRTIAIYEQERLSKEHTKVWRLCDEQIKAGIIHQALESTGAKRDKKEHFASLISRMASLSESESVEPVEGPLGRQGNDAKTNRDESGISYADDGPDEVDGGEDDESYSSMDEDVSDSQYEKGPSICDDERGLPLHREINGPFMWHASLNHLDPFHTVPSEASLTTDKNTDDVLRVSDGSELVEELREEEHLDSADLAAAKEAEAELWAEFGLAERAERGPEPHEAPEPIPEQRTVAFDPTQNKVVRNRLRSMKYGTARGVKSSVYVEDSD